MMIAVATLLIFSGKTSPNKAWSTGPTPNPYPKDVQIVHNGNKLSLISKNVSFSKTFNIGINQIETDTKKSRHTICFLPSLLA